MSLLRFAHVAPRVEPKSLVPPADELQRRLLPRISRPFGRMPVPSSGYVQIPAEMKNGTGIAQESQKNWQLTWKHNLQTKFTWKHHY